jgi:cob(I)alamin adenosyltransferase
MAKIYTRHGDQGLTSLLGGTRLPKSHPRLHAYGTIDELNAHLGQLAAQIKAPAEQTAQTIILRIQQELFIAGGLLACDDPTWLTNLPRLLESHIAQLETEIDWWSETLPPLKNFILPGGIPAALTAHVARTVCRRAERWTFDVLQDSKPEFHSDYQTVLKYLNRLSDHLFTLSRWLNHQNQTPETPWIPA